MDPNTKRKADDIEDRGIPEDHDPTLRQEALDLWREAPSWYDLTELNRRYLEGRLPLSPTCNEYIWSETSRFSNIPELLDYGIISTNLSPGTLEDPELLQRPFLLFSIPTHGLATTSPDALINFIQKLRASTEVYTVRFQYSNAPHGIERDQGISSLMLYGSYHSLPINNPPWTITPEGPGGSDKINFVQAMRRNAPETMPIQTRGSIFRDDENPIRASHMADPLQISVLAPD